MNLKFIFENVLQKHRIFASEHFEKNSGESGTSQIDSLTCMFCYIYTRQKQNYHHTAASMSVVLSLVKYDS